MAAPLSARAAATPALPSAVLKERLQIFDYVWKEIRDNYYDPYFNGVDWQSVRLKYRPRAAAASDDAEFHSLLRSMVGELRDAHTRVLNARETADRELKQSTSTGVILFQVEGTPVVFDVRPSSPAAEAGLEPGMVVLEINGTPARQAVEQARAEVGPSSSATASLVLSYLRLISAEQGETLRLRLRRKDGGVVDVNLPRRRLDTAPRFETRLLPTGQLYVKFDRFREPVAKLFRQALQRSPSATGLIFDLRSNTGGDGEEAMKTITPLLDRRTLIARLRTRTGKPPSALLGLVKLPLEFYAGEAGGQLYRGPIIILANEGTGSSSEVVAGGLQETGRARIFGSPSCGCVLGVLKRRKLKNGGALAISEVGLTTGRGRRLEGKGVVPDKAISLTLADLQAGRDVALETAVKELSR